MKKTRQRTRKQLPVSSSMMVPVEPLTPNQEKIFEAYDEGKHMFIYGCAGTGKTFTCLYKALSDCLGPTPAYERVYLVRSLVATREIGFLPGDHEDKSSLYQIPYKNMVKYMFELGNDRDFDMLYGQLKAQESIKFWSTSFLRGVTLDNSVIIIDEMQNLNFHELDSIMTRVGENCRIIFAGDYLQSDFKSDGEKDGLMKFLNIIERMSSFSMVQFGWGDIVRSGIVRDYIMTKEMMGLK